MIDSEDFPLLLIIALLACLVYCTGQRQSEGDWRSSTRASHINGRGLTEWFSREPVQEVRDHMKEVAQARSDLLLARAKRSTIVQEKAPIDQKILNAQVKDPELLADQQRLAKDLAREEQSIEQLTQRIRDCEQLAVQITEKMNPFQRVLLAVGI